MTTAQDMINRAAKTAGILAQGQTLTGGVNADALHLLNRMLARWRNSGVDLKVPTHLAAATVFVDVADEEAVEINLTLRLMVEHKRPVQPGLSAAADDAFTELQAKYMIIPEMKFDRALTRDYLPHKRLDEA